MPGAGRAGCSAGVLEASRLSGNWLAPGASRSPPSWLGPQLIRTRGGRFKAGGSVPCQLHNSLKIESLPALQTPDAILQITHFSAPLLSTWHEPVISWDAQGRIPLSLIVPFILLSRMRDPSSNVADFSLRNAAFHIPSRSAFPPKAPHPRALPPPGLLQRSEDARGWASASPAASTRTAQGSKQTPRCWNRRAGENPRQHPVGKKSDQRS